MGQFCQPRVFLTGYTTINLDGVMEYLHYKKKHDFLTTLEAARRAA